MTNNIWTSLDSTEKKAELKIVNGQAINITDKRTNVTANKELYPEKQGAACRKLFASIITMAIRDATMKPTKDKFSSKLTIHSEARSAMAFLFSDRCEVYLQFLDINSKYFRKSLVECMSGAKNNSLSSIFSKLVSPLAQKAFMFNYRYWENIPVPATAYKDFEYDD